MSKPVKIKMLLSIIGLSIFVLIICGYYINKQEADKKVLLHGIVVANIGLMQQKENLEKKNNLVLTEFNNQVTISQGNPKTLAFRDEAFYVHKLSNEVNDYIEQMKVDLVEYTDGCSTYQAKERVLHPFQVRRKDNYKKTTKWFGTNKDAGQTGKSHELKLKLEAYHAALIEFIKTPLKYKKDEVIKNLSNLDVELPAEFRNTGSQNTWEMFYFYKQPLCGALTELTKWQNNVRNAEGIMLTYLFDQISATSFKFDAAMAAIISKSNTVISGTNFEAEVFIAAYSSGLNPKIIYGTSVDEITGHVSDGIELPPDKYSYGKGHISIPTSGSGERTCAGIIVIPGPITGKEMKYMFSTKYTVTPR